MPRTPAALARFRAQRRMWYAEIMSEMECADCGQQPHRKRRIILEWHHRIPRKKGETAVSTLIHTGRSIARIMEEMAKCDVLCIPCHRAREGKTKINIHQAKTIRALHARNPTIQYRRFLAEEYGVLYRQILNIIAGNHWKER